MTAKVGAIINYPVPTTKKEVMSFWEWRDITESSVETFATLCEPLTNFLKKNYAFV